MKIKSITSLIIIGFTTASLLQFSAAAAPTAAAFSIASTSPLGTLPNAATASVSGVKTAGAAISYTAEAICPGSPVVKVTITPPASATSWLIPMTGLSGGIACSFTVTTTDATGSTTSTAQSFTPQSLPASPTVGATSGGKNSITLNWMAPTNTGGLPITSYTVVNETLSTATTVTASVTGTNIAALTAGAKYSFTLQANNMLGASTKVSYPQVTVPAVPSSPVAPTLKIAVGTTSDVSLTWTPPASDGGSPITFYNLVLIPSSGSSISKRVDATTLTTGLTSSFPAVANGTWSATVAAENVIGIGPASGTSAPLVLGPVSTPPQGSGGSGGGTPPPVPAPQPQASSTPTPSVSATTSPSPSPTSSPSPSQSPSGKPTPNVDLTPTPLASISVMPTFLTKPITTPAPVISTLKKIGGGIALLSSKSTLAITKVLIAGAARNAAKALLISGLIGKGLEITVKSLPKSTLVKAVIVVGGKTYVLGSIKTNSKGVAIVPAFLTTKAGTYSVQLTTAKGVKYFIKLVVKSKK